MGVRAWLLLLLLVPAVTGLAVCQSVRAAPAAAPPCKTASCPPVTIPPPPPPSPARPRVWAGYTRGEAIKEFHVLIGLPALYHLPGTNAVHAQCKTFRAWKVSAPGWRVYIIDERKKGYWATFAGPALGCHP